MMTKPKQPQITLKVDIGLGRLSSSLRRVADASERIEKNLDDRPKGVPLKEAILLVLGKGK